MMLGFVGSKTSRSSPLGGEAVRQGEPAQRHALLGAPQFLDLVLPHDRFSRLLVVPTGGRIGPVYRAFFNGP